MAERIVDELRDRDQDRDVEVIVAPELSAEGDPDLLEVAMQNLLENAWKFSANQPTARVELGSKEIEGETAFFVRDNGAGFDMAHSQKLFGPFQRLHRRDEFPGLGIGLATVMRILRRHGGRIWATGEVGGGATFYFTL